VSWTASFVTSSTRVLKLTSSTRVLKLLYTCVLILVRVCAQVRKFRDELHQPVKEISDCVRLIRNECHAVISAARSFEVPTILALLLQTYLLYWYKSMLRSWRFQEFGYFIDSLERQAVELLVNQTRCQLRHHNLVLQALKDLVRALSHDMYNLHSRTARLEAAAAEFEVPPPLVLY